MASFPRRSLSPKFPRRMHLSACYIAPTALLCVRLQRRPTSEAFSAPLHCVPREEVESLRSAKAGSREAGAVYHSGSGLVSWSCLVDGIVKVKTAVVCAWKLSTHLCVCPLYRPRRRFELRETSFGVVF